MYNLPPPLSPLLTHKQVEKKDVCPSHTLSIYSPPPPPSLLPTPIHSIYNHCSQSTPPPPHTAHSHCSPTNNNIRLEKETYVPTSLAAMDKKNFIASGFIEMRVFATLLSKTGTVGIIPYCRYCTVVVLLYHCCYTDVTTPSLLYCRRYNQQPCQTLACNMTLILTLS